MVSPLSFTVPPFTRDNYLGKGGRGIVFRTSQDSAVKLVSLQALPFASASYELLEVQDFEEYLLVNGRKITLAPSVTFDLRFAQREYRALQRLQGRDHLLQVQSHGYAAVEGMLCSTLSMKYAGGAPLSSFQEDRYGLPDIGKIVTDMIDALAGLAEAGLIHCDVKPANIIYQARGAAHQGNAVLIDFDSVRFHDEGLENILLGTDSYFTPDHIHHHFTPALDLFSLGLVARTLVLGGGELMTRYHRLPASKQLDAHLRYLCHYSNFQRDILVMELEQMGAPPALAEAIGGCLDAVPSRRDPQPLRQEAQRLVKGEYPTEVYHEHSQLLCLS